MKIEKKLSDIRKLMKNYEIDCYLIPHTDEFLNEFLPPYSRRLEWISGFSGSAGDIVVTKKNAYLFVDGRYTLQAADEVNKNYYIIHNYKDTSVPDLLKKILTKNSVVGFDGNIETLKNINNYKKILKNKVTFISINKNLIDILWKNKPKKERSRPFIQPAIFSGESNSSKINKIINYIKKYKATSYFISSCDSICWIFNLRASDLEYSPLLLSKAIINNNGNCIIFTDAINLKNKNVKNGIKIQFLPLNKLNEYIELSSNSKQIYICDPNQISFNTKKLIRNNNNKIIYKDNYIEYLKSIKNTHEINGMKNAHIRDGATLTKFIYWIKNNISKKNISELDAIKYLDNLRSKNKNFFSLSFPTIAGTGPNGAIVHYHATNKTNRTINNKDLFLVDSGAQYFDGTTDVTRTITFENPSKEQKKMYTLVLKGHIAVAISKFRKSEKGKLLDKRARKFLIRNKSNFDHGTGHGVGSFLNVHEGPQSISPRSKVNFKKGMIVSNEPGFYKKDKYGIRIENLILTKNLKDQLCFETLTMAPLEPNLISWNMLNSEEKNWINKYHKKVFKNLSPYLEKKEILWLNSEIKSLK